MRRSGSIFRDSLLDCLSDGVEALPTSYTVFFLGLHLLAYRYCDLLQKSRTQAQTMIPTSLDSNRST